MSNNVRWTRTGYIKNSRVMEAIAWSKEICGWAQKKHNVTVETWLDAAGQPNTIRWTADYADIASFDAKMTAVMMDPEYWTYVQKAYKDDLFVDNTTVDTLSKKF